MAKTAEAVRNSHLSEEKIVDSDEDETMDSDREDTPISEEGLNGGEKSSGEPRWAGILATSSHHFQGPEAVRQVWPAKTKATTKATSQSPTMKKQKENLLLSILR